MTDWFRNIEFAYPLAFGLFAVIPFLIFWYIKKGSSTRAYIPVSSVYAFSFTSWKSKTRHIPFILRLLALCCVILALTRPQKKSEVQKISGEGIDIMLCMDVSGSMGSRDILPSRLEAAKEVAIEFIQSRPLDRIGLVIFSGESFTQCPLTTDRTSLVEQIQSLETQKYLADGTVIGEGLATAVDRLKKSKSPSKVIILLTDGKESAPVTRIIDPVTAMEIAKTQNVKVYTVGVGAAPSTIVESTDNPVSNKNSSSAFLDETLLRRIATETGGKYFRALDRDGLKRVYQQIDTMEKSKAEITVFKKFQDYFPVILLAALGFLFLEMILRFTVYKSFP
ncbi:MAG: VWA domain-containing protein [Bacteroidetes bacterium]|nr:VWA domain-containing protein [Bacteroidota bacterium]MBS1634238.1 VWA domain-containing protein [Bacteroidota bacterium]